MADLSMIALMVAFVAVCVLYVAWCDRIIGPDPAPGAETAAPDADTVAEMSA